MENQNTNDQSSGITHAGGVVFRLRRKSRRYLIGKARPRKERMAAYAALRNVGKKEARARLEDLNGG